MSPCANSQELLSHDYFTEVNGSHRQISRVSLYLPVCPPETCFLIVLGFNDTSVLVGHVVSSPRVFLLCWGLTTRQPLWVILCRLPEKGRKEIEEIVEEMKETIREETGTGMKVKKQKK